MAILNIFSTAVAPTGFWSWLILSLFSFVGNYGWRIVLFTLCLKLVLSPLDIYQRYAARKNQIITRKLAEPMKKLQKIYASDPKMLAQKQMELNKKAGVSYFSSCLPAIVTLVVFITLLWWGLQPISQYQNFREYELLNVKYHEYYSDEAVQTEYEAVKLTDWDSVHAELVAKTEEIKVSETQKLKDEIMKKAYDDAIAAGKSETDAEAAKEAAGESFVASEHTADVDARVLVEIERRTEETVRTTASDNVKAIAQNEVFEFYGSDVKTSFLWVKNVWNPDTFWTAPINDFNTFKTNIGDYGTSPQKAGFENAEELSKMLAEYDDVMFKLMNTPEYNRTNGYLILPILTILLSVIMQIITFRQQKESGQMNAQSESTSKIMMFVMPVMMGWFSFKYTAAFAIYLVMNYLVSLVISLIGTLIVKLADSKMQYQLENGIQKYGRPDFSDQKNENERKNDKK